MEINNNISIEKCIKNVVEKLIIKEIDEEIENKVKKFKHELEDRKDRYIAEVMKGIRILHERNMNGMDYKIIFENVYRMEKSDNK